MKHTAETPFDSIESAHEFVSVFAEAVADARREIESDIEREASGNPSRRLAAFRLAAYNVEKLEQHLNKSRRILNDLRSLRRLLFEERSSAPSPAVTKPALVEAKDSNARKPDLALSAALQTPPARPAGRAVA